MTDRKRVRNLLKNLGIDFYQIHTDIYLYSKVEFLYEHDHEGEVSFCFDEEGTFRNIDVEM